MKSILKLFSEHNTFIQPDALKYITSKDDPNEFASFLIKNLKEYPLILTIDNIKNIEESTKKIVIPKTEEILNKKKIQNKLLNEIYNKNMAISAPDGWNPNFLKSLKKGRIKGSICTKCKYDKICFGIVNDSNKDIS